MNPCMSCGEDRQALAPSGCKDVASHGVAEHAARKKIEAQAEELQVALANLLHAFAGMPSTGLEAEDPRSDWWTDAAQARSAARRALAAR